jgi:ubiquitin thioesterase OTU1
MRTRIRGPGGASTITLPDDATVGDLIAQITEKTSLPSFDIKYGYPPKPLTLEYSEKSLPLRKLVVKLDGEQLTISAKADDNPHVTEPAKQQNHSSTNKSSQNATTAPSSFSFTDIPGATAKDLPSGPVSLQRKTMDGDVPTEPFPERNATVGKCPVLMSPRLVDNKLQSSESCPMTTPVSSVPSPTPSSQQTIK